MLFKIYMCLLTLVPFSILTMLLNVSKLCIDDVLLVVLVRILFSICILILMISFICTLIFNSYITRNQKASSTIDSIVYNEKANLNFFVAYIIPISFQLDDMYKFIAYIIVIVLFVVLLLKTNLVYGNPVLYILGFKIYEIKFKNGEVYNVISKKNLGVGDVVYSKKLFENVCYVRSVK